MVLTYDSYSETLESQKQNEDELKTIKERMANIENLLVVIPPFLQNIKPEMLSKLQLSVHNKIV
jgi:hypothetical protein